MLEGGHIGQFISAGPVADVPDRHCRMCDIHEQLSESMSSFLKNFNQAKAVDRVNLFSTQVADLT